MQSSKKIYFFIGTVAEFNKLVPILKELQNKRIDFSLIDSGQNRINYQDFKTYLGEIHPILTINPKANKSSTSIFFLWALVTFFKGWFQLFLLFKKNPRNQNVIVVHGDTVTSTIGACLAKLLGLVLVHVEAGYFSRNFLEPFPEEICKNINSYLADIMFAPTDWALKNLDKFQGIKISTKYNTNIDSFWWALNQKLVSPLKLKGKYYLLIVHRQEHVLFKKMWTKNIMEHIIKQANKDLVCVVLNHPLTVEIIKSLKVSNKSVKILDQLSYGQFLQVLKNSEFIATDSATIQQEAYYLGKPYLGLANYSVQTEGLNENAVLSKGDPKIIDDFLKNYKKYQRSVKKPKKSPAKIIVKFLQSF